MSQPVKSGGCKSHAYFSFRCGTKTEANNDADQIYSIFTVIKKQGDGLKKLIQRNQEIQAYNMKKNENYGQTKAYNNRFQNNKPLSQNLAKNQHKVKKLKSKHSKDLVISPKNQTKSNKKRSVEMRKSALSLKQKVFEDKSKQKNVKNQVMLGSAIDYYGENAKNKGQTMTTVRSEESKIRQQMKSQIHLKKKFSLPSDQYNDVRTKSPEINMKRSMQDPVSSYFRRIINMHQKHHEQVKRANNLNQKQMRRLLKIHEIEKQKLKQQLNNSYQDR